MPFQQKLLTAPVQLLTTLVQRLAARVQYITRPTCAPTIRLWLGPFTFAVLIFKAMKRRGGYVILQTCSVSWLTNRTRNKNVIQLRKGQKSIYMVKLLVRTVKSYPFCVTCIRFIYFVQRTQALLRMVE